jgi:hypothetical protein
MSSDVDEASPPTEQEASRSKPIDYDRTRGGVSRRQFRFLLFLTLINTILLTGYIVGPSASGLIKGGWNEFQARRALRKQQQQSEAFLNQLRTHSAPADQIMYEENPIIAAKLLASSSDFTTIPTSADSIMHLTPQPWQPPVYRKDPAIITQLQQPVSPLFPRASSTVLLHAFHNPAGQERLVWIVVSGEQLLLYTATNESRRDLQAHTDRKLTAYIVDITTSLMPSKSAALIPKTPTLKTTVTWTRGATWENGTITTNPAGLFRFYAAQPDPKDRSHFTIDYTLDDQRNTIDGYLKNDDTIQFIPRAGRIIDSKHEGQIWDPFAAPATTQP